LFPQIPANGVEVTIDPLAINTEVNYKCMDSTNFFIRGPPTSNMCDNMGMYASATAPTCERGKRFQSCVSLSFVIIYPRSSFDNFFFFFKLRTNIEINTRQFFQH